LNIKKASSGNRSFLKSILTLLTGTTVAQAIPIGISPVLSRIYTPEDFGLLALFLSITSMVGVAVTARYELAIMLPEDDKDAINLLALSILIAATLSSVLFLVVLIWGKTIAILLGNEQIYPWLYFVPLSLMLTGIYQAFNYWSNRKQQYQRLAINRVTQSSTTAVVNTSVGLVKNGAFGLIIGNIISQIIATAMLSIKSIKNEKISLSYISFQRMKLQAKRYDQFPKLSVWSALLNNASSQLPIFILSAFFNSTIVGWYSLANRILKIPMSVLGNAISQVFFQTSSKLKSENPNNIKVVTYKVYKIMLVVGIIPMATIFGFGDLIFAFVFGEAWFNAGVYSRLLSIWLLLVFVSSPLSMMFTIMEREGLLLLFNISIFICRTISLLVGVVFFKDPLITVILFASTGAIFWLWHCAYILKIVGITYFKSIGYTCSIIILGFSTSLLIRFLFLQNLW
jgi:lipopolysaccharide exporter